MEGFLSGRVAWVTGGASGMGRAMAMAFAEAGADVAIGSLLSDAAAGVAGEGAYLPGGEELEAIFNTDEGARYVCEFAIGFNPYVLEPMMDILFDEKIAGSLHFTPGQAYDDADNGNRSDIHWDLVLIQRPEYGGGKIVFDGETIRKDGQFVVSDLEGLTPEQLG